VARSRCIATAQVSAFVPAFAAVETERRRLVAAGQQSARRRWLPFVEDIRTALFENAKEINVTVAGIRAAGVIPLGFLDGAV